MIAVVGVNRTRKTLLFPALIRVCFDTVINVFCDPISGVIPSLDNMTDSVSLPMASLLPLLAIVTLVMPDLPRAMLFGETGVAVAERVMTDVATLMVFVVDAHWRHRSDR